MNIRPSVWPRATSRSSFSIKHPSWLNLTCMYCSTIWPTETSFFVMVGTCKNVLDIGLFAFVPEWDISYTLNGVSCVIPSLDIDGSIRLSQISKPIFVRRHVIGCSRVNKPYIFWRRGVGLTWCQHWVCFMPHYEHSSMVVIVRVLNIVHELLASRSRLSFLLSTFLCIVAEFSTVLVKILFIMNRPK